MWPFNSKKSLEYSGIFHGFTDWHSHILPGVDDGIPNMEQSLKVLERFEQLGIVEQWLTPHVMEDIPNTTSHLQEKFTELQAAYNGPIKLHLAAEYMLDSGFEQRLQNDDLLCIGQEASKTLLVETSYFCPPMDLYGLLWRIREKGYQPLLAHPERYIYMDDTAYEKLRDMGVQFQCNICSLACSYGKDASRKFSDFLSKGWISVLGTDIHRLGSFNDSISRKNIGIKQLSLLTDSFSFA